MSVVNQQTGGSVNDDNAAVVAAADQPGEVGVKHAEDSINAAEVGIAQSYERLKKSRGGYLAYLTRLYKDAERLMTDFKGVPKHGITWHIMA